MNVGYAFCHPPRQDIDYFRNRFALAGGILRTIFDAKSKSTVTAVFQNNLSHLTVLSSLNQCSPFNITSLVNSIVGVKFRTSPYFLLFILMKTLSINSVIILTIGVSSTCPMKLPSKLVRF